MKPLSVAPEEAKTQELMLNARVSVLKRIVMLYDTMNDTDRSVMLDKESARCVFNINLLSLYILRVVECGQRIEKNVFFWPSAISYHKAPTRVAWALMYEPVKSCATFHPVYSKYSGDFLYLPDI